jgi:hypothetical protein
LRQHRIIRENRDGIGRAGKEGTAYRSRVDRQREAKDKEDREEGKEDRAQIGEAGAQESGPGTQGGA